MMGASDQTTYPNRLLPYAFKVVFAGGNWKRTFALSVRIARDFCEFGGEFRYSFFVVLTKIQAHKQLIDRISAKQVGNPFHYVAIATAIT